MCTNCDNPSEQDLSQLVDFFEARYNFNAVPYISYPQRVTNILYSDNISNPNCVTEAPYNGLPHYRQDGQWVVYTQTDSYTEAESDARYYPLSSNPAGYIATETDPTVGAHIKSITTTEKSNWNTSYSWGNHNSIGYALASNLHNAVTISTANGLSLAGQVLSLALASGASNGAMSSADKTKLDSVVAHNAVTLGTANGLSLSTQILSLALATTSLAGAMSSTDKVKLDGLTEYVHPTGFTNQPVSPLTGASVISRVTVNTNGHVTGVSTRTLTINDFGIVPADLSKTDDTNVTLTLGGTPTTSLLQAVNLTLGWNGFLSVTRGGIGIGNLTSGEVLIGNGTNAVSTLNREGIDTRISFPASAHTLGFHSDVNLTTLTTNQVLLYNGTTWTNQTLDLNDFTFTETDPVFTGFTATSRTSNTFYSAPSSGSGIASFRAITASDIPNIYVRFDTAQLLTELQKQQARVNLGISNFSGSFEPVFSKGDVTTNTPTVISFTNPTARLVGLSDLIITHGESGWVDKTTLAGAFIISNLTVDDYGHISNWVTRELTLADLGYVDFDPSVMQDQIDQIQDDLDALTIVVNGLSTTLVNDKNYIHVQSSPAAIWTYTHGLNKKPSVTIIDSAGSIVLAKLTYVDLNNIEIDFDGSVTSGEAINN